MKTLLVRSLWVLTALGFTGCNSTVKPQPVPAPGTVVAFSATPGELALPGDKATLSWTTENATRVSLEQVGQGPIAIDPRAASGTLEVALAKDALFVLTAQGEGGTDSRSLGVAVKRVMRGVVFDAVPRAIAAGDSATLVWNAPGAAAVSIKEVGSAMVDLRGQKESGSVQVGPGKSTSYELDADGTKQLVTIEVGIAIYGFGLDGPSPLPGQQVNLSWETSGGAKLTLKRAGMAAVVLTVTDATRVASGTFSEAVPAGAPVDGLLTYTLDLEQGTAKVSRTLTVRVGGSVKITQFLVPALVRPGGTVVVQWKTTGGERLELWVDDASFFLAPDAATVAVGSRLLKAPTTGTLKVKLVVSNSRGAVDALEKTTAVIGPPTFNSFTADKSTVAVGAEPVVLSWNVTNARHVRISEAGQPVFEKTAGTLDTGTLTVFPNRAITTYLLEADNGAGDAIAVKSRAVVVTTPAVLTFSAQVPLAAASSITGHTVVGGTTILGLPNSKKNVAGDAFVDIAGTGTPIDLVSAFSTATVVDIGPFSTRIFGRPVSGNSISVSPDGFIVFSSTAQTGPFSPSVPAIGTQLFPLSLAPALKNLDVGTGQIGWQVDVVGDEQRLIVQWTGVQPAGVPTAPMTFQLQVFTRGKVVFAYKKLPAAVGTIGVGVVNSEETDVLGTAVAPVEGDVFTFFTQTTLPASVKVELLPYSALVKVPTGWVAVEGSGLLSPGQIAVTEINPRPAASVTGGEWLEVTNYTAFPFDLKGWVLNLGSGLTHPITTSVLVPANGRILLAQRLDLGDATAGVTAAYSYGAASSLFVMSDSSGSLSLDIAGAPYATISWDALTLPDAGLAVRADAPSPSKLYANGAQQSFCPGTGSPLYGTAAQAGTPGTLNARCFPYTLVALDGGSFEALAGNGGTLIVQGDAGSSATDDNVYPVTLASPAKLFGQSYPTLSVGTNGWMTPIATTLPEYVNKVLPSALAPAGSIAPFWDDLSGNPGIPGSGIYTVHRDPDGIAGNGDEYTIVSWEGWQVDSTPGQNLNFQVKLFETGNLEYHYGTMGDAGTELTQRGSSATSWLEDVLGKSALPINLNSATAPGIRANTAFRYTYTP